MSERVESHFEASVDEGTVRLRRRWTAMLATGAVGGIDVGVGVLALLVVEHQTGSRLLGALAFTIGFFALTLGNSELFTENFLVPITAVVARNAGWGALARLWTLTGVANLAGGYLMMAVVMAGLPELGGTANKVARFYPELGLGPKAFNLAILGGVVITLLTWMEVGTASIMAKLVAAGSASFVLAAAPLDHAVVVSLEMFAALRGAAAFGYTDWLEVTTLAAVGNLVGGVGLVTLLRLAQVGRRKVAAEKAGDRGGAGAGAGLGAGAGGDHPARPGPPEGVTPPGSTR
ncbi:MAG: formate/nitrite transporter family protein [Acidimicrobiales bacterium]